MHSNERPDGVPPEVSRSDDICHRCGGLMITDYYIDLKDDTGQIDVMVRRCTGCGEVIDPIILQNRKSPVPNLLYGTKQRTFGQRVEKPASREKEGDEQSSN
jgi:hypothetical protein